MTDMNEFILGLARPEPSAGGAGSSTDNADDDPPTPTGPRAVLQANLDKAAAGLAAGSPALTVSGQPKGQPT